MLLMFIFFTGSMMFVGLLGSILLGISQITFFSSWVCLELNMLLFLMLMNVFEKSAPSASMKYFIVQSVGSSVFLWSIGLESAGLGLMSEISICGALSLKLGIAPFQGWFVSVLSTLGWELVFLASTLQKILPIFLLSALKSEFLMLFMGLSVLVSILGSMGQTFLKKILAYSSVFMTVWLMACEGEIVKSLEYLAAYSNALAVLVASFATFLVEEVGEVLSSANSICGGLSLSGFLSMGGCPPFVGFYAKIMVIISMLSHGQYIWLVVLVLTSVFLLYIYMRLFYFSLSFKGSEWSTSRSSRFMMSMALTMGGLLLLPWLLCLSVLHSKFWTFSI